MTDNPATNCIQIFFADTRTHGEWPLLWQREKDAFRHIAKRAAAIQIDRVAQALEALKITAQARVALQGVMSMEMWVAEWGALANRCAVAIIPRDFTPEELIETLAENNSRLIFVDRFATARTLMNASALLPNLSHIVCLEKNAGASPPLGPITLMTWREFCDLGNGEPEQSSEAKRAVMPKDMAIMFYRLSETGERKATSYTHAELLKDARRIDAVLGYQTVAETTAMLVEYRYKGARRRAISYAGHVESDRHYIRATDTVMAAVRQEHVIGHIAAYFVPVLKDAAVQIAGEEAAVTLPFYRPHVIIGESGFFDAMRRHITEQLHRAGKRYRIMLGDALQLGRKEYEFTGMLALPRRLQYVFLRKMLEKKVARLLGGRLRLLIGVDDAVDYDTLVFFHTFGITLIELPPALLNIEG